MSCTSGSFRGQQQLRHPRLDIYVEQLSGDQVQEVHAFQANGALPRGLPLLAYRFRSALARVEMRAAYLRLGVLSLGGPTSCRDSAQKLFAPFFQLEDVQELRRLPGEVTRNAEPLLPCVELPRGTCGNGPDDIREGPGRGLSLSSTTTR